MNYLSKMTYVIARESSRPVSKDLVIAGYLISGFVFLLGIHLMLIETYNWNLVLSISSFLMGLFGFIHQFLHWTVFGFAPLSIHGGHLTWKRFHYQKLPAKKQKHLISQCAKAAEIAGLLGLAGTISGIIFIVMDSQSLTTMEPTQVLQSILLSLGSTLVGTCIAIWMVFLKPHHHHESK